MTTTTLTVGDWSDDGHGKTAAYTYEHNFSKEALASAYAMGSLKLGIVRPERKWDITLPSFHPNYSWVEHNPTTDVMQYVAESYEETSIPEDIHAALVAQGITASDADFENYYENDDGSANVSGAEGFANLWMQIAALGHSELSYKLMPDDGFNIGGYGCL